MRAHSSFAAVALLATSVTFTSSASADAVDPPPSCPSGETGVPDHGGGRCVKDAPTNCPPGWTGALGGTCIVRGCLGDDECEGGTCREQSVCMRRHFRPNYGAAPSTRGDIRLAAFGPPPAEVGPPIPYWAAESYCGAANPCTGEDRRCEPMKVCLPRGVAAATVLPPVADGSVPPPSRGCAGCAVVGSDRDGSRLALVATMLVLVATAWRASR